MDDNQNLLEVKDNSLEAAETVRQTNSSGLSTDGNERPNPTTPQVSGTDGTSLNYKPKRNISQRVQTVIGKLNVYLLLFILIVLLAAIAAYASYKASDNASKSDISGQELSDADLQALKNNESQVGDATQTLTIASNTIFNGRVLIRDGLDVAGAIHVGETLSLTGITVSGTSSLEDVQVGANLSIAGNTAIQGILTVTGNLTGSNASFAGTVSTSTLVTNQLALNQNLQLNRHVEAGGSTPSISSATGVGGGGTVSINGADTAGTVNINFGAGPVAGVLANITFANSFYQTPHIAITPVGSNCANLNYYISRTTGGFSIATTNAGAAGTSCSFDYIAID